MCQGVESMYEVRFRFHYNIHFWVKSVESMYVEKYTESM